MTRHRHIAAIVLFAAVAVAPGTAEAPLSEAVTHKIDAVFARYTAEVPGCAVGVFQHGRIAYAKGYGSANIEYGVPLTPQTPMITGSLSKQFTAAAVALLVEQGRLSLSDDVHKYVPELADYGKTITIDHLVHHTSGLRDFWALVQAAGMRNDDGYTVADVIAVAARQKNLNFTPGAEYNYSNTGYVVLGVIVQRVTGKSLRQFADEQIFTPLGMTNSHYHDDHNQPVRGRAFAYSPVASGGWTINIWNNDIVGQGGVMTTVEDLQKWDENFYSGKVGGKGFLARQLERGTLNNGTVIPYAFGVQVGAYRGVPMVEHAGSTGGYRTDIARFPAAHTSVVTLCNVSNADAGGMALRVADAVLGDTFTTPAPAPDARAAAGPQQPAATVVPTDAALSAMAGRYYSEELNATYELTKTAASLVLGRPRAAATTLQAVDQETFRGGGYTIRFAGPVAGKATSFTLEAGRIRGIVFNRVPQA